MNKLILLIGALLLSSSLPVFAESITDKAFKAGLKAVELEITDLEELKRSSLSTQEKQNMLFNRVCELTKDKAIAEAYVDWFIEGIGRAVDAMPPHMVDSIPPNLENADIPEYLVKQLLNASAVQRAGAQVTNSKGDTVLNLSIKITPEEYRRLSTTDQMINFIMNHEDRIFVRIDK